MQGAGQCADHRPRVAGVLGGEIAHLHQLRAHHPSRHPLGDRQLGRLRQVLLDEQRTLAGAAQPQRGLQATVGAVVGEQVRKKAAQDRAVALAVDPGDEGFHLRAIGMQGIDQHRIGEAETGSSGEGDDGHGGIVGAVD
ncbi:hypothetical protein NB706_002711 [Xanthomonas sacchari]|nr:hypothetical protein [Xanthomonas sacchari]